MSKWEVELLDEMPEEFTLTKDGTYIQRTHIHEVEYRSLDGLQKYRGYECFSRELTMSEYNQITNHIN